MSARAFRGVSGAFALMALGGCATFGGNVKGSFSCQAPDGVCAPSSSIDDRALAMISGEEGGAGASPAGSYINVEMGGKGARHAAPASLRRPVQQGDAGRTQERVLRIVFQPYVDERGRLHEASAVHAVVDSGRWQQEELSGATAIPDRDAAAKITHPDTLAEAVDRADPPEGIVAPIDPNLPDPAAVEAARARNADPLAAIRSEVAARLSPRAGRTPLAAAAATQAVPAPPAGGQGADVSTSLRPRSSPKASSLACASGAPSSPGSQSVSPRAHSEIGPARPATKADPRDRERAAEIARAARQAAREAPLAEDKARGGTAVRATAFPAAVPEDN